MARIVAVHAEVVRGASEESESPYSAGRVIPDPFASFRDSGNSARLERRDAASEIFARRPLVH